MLSCWFRCHYTLAFRNVINIIFVIYYNIRNNDENSCGYASVVDQLWLGKMELSYLPLLRSSHQRCSVKEGVLRNFAKFTGKHLRQSLFSNKVVGLRPATLLKKDSGTGVSLWILRNLQEHLFYRTPFFSSVCLTCFNELQGDTKLLDHLLAFIFHIPDGIFPNYDFESIFFGINIIYS